MRIGRRAAAASLGLLAALCLALASCESLTDPRAWGNGPGRGITVEVRVRSAKAEKAGAEKPPERRGAEPEAKAAAPAAAKKADPLPAAERGPGALARTVSAGEGPGALVLKAAIARVDGGKVFKGSCYDFASAVFADAGFPPAKVKRVFAGKAAGPFADPSLIQPGDWLYITHVYSATVEHSLIFVSWLDFGERIALTIDYPGEDRLEPGRYRVADLYKVWGVNRAAR